MRPDLKRTPIFGLGCAGGASGLAHAAGYLRAFPGECTLLIAVELTSLTLQPADVSVANQIAPVTSGPYRYIRHPNYLAVVLEVACVPFIRGLVITAAACFAIDAIILAFRIRLEEHALGDSYQSAFAERGRFIPTILKGSCRRRAESERN
jgi:Isoprenylcysteine carboxyl methyltransferase (ICMT) family